MDIFKDCIDFLEKILSTNKYDKNNKYTTKLFCLGYIKTYCYTFIKMFDIDNPKFNEPDKIIDTINKKKLVNKMIRLYIYKILFHKKQMDAFLNQNNKIKYKLREYEGFKDFLIFPEEEPINYGFETLDNDNYERIYKILEKNKRECFKNIIKKQEIDNNLHIDNFYIAASNLILLRLKTKDFETSEIYDNFYKNICNPLFEKGKLPILIQFLFNPEKYQKIKKDYGINSDNIETILYGYRYTLNEFFDNEDDNDHDYIYSSLYDINKAKYLAEKCYPGNYTRDESYYELYSKIKNHFKERANEGCFVCLCNKGFYHSVSSGFPGVLEKGLKCQYCSKEIGTISKEIYDEKELNTGYEIVKRENYFRIFIDDDEIDSIKGNKDKNEKLDEINYMTLKEFEEKYMSPLFKNEKGLIPNIDKNDFKKENKTIRNLSQISYRLLNYILYSHLFFARLFTNSERFDKYKPKDMSWGETLNESFNLLKNELSKKGINFVEIFTNYAFKDLFTKLHEKECIDNYEDLIDFENDLETLIQEKITKSIEETKKYNEFININSKDKDSSINLFKEKYENNKYKKEEYPYYEYFYYTDYLDENYIMNKILSLEETKEYPLLNKYIKYKKTINENNDNYSLDKLYLFNKVLNLFNEKYSHKITKEFSKKQIVKDSDIYKSSENSKLIDRFIKFYNKLKLTDNTGKEIKLKSEVSHLNDFILDYNNEIGRTYKNIYTIFIKKQNEEIEDLLNIKIKEGIFNSNCKKKINVQQVKEDDIFTFNKFSFIDVIFNSSCRKIIDNKNYQNYNQFEINLNTIESNMTELLLKNRKLINEDLIIEFSYNNEIFNNEINDLITTFKISYKTKTISIKDKVIFYSFVKNNEGNLDKYKDIIDDFMTLMQYLNSLKKKDKNNDVSEKSIIYDVIKNNIGDNVNSDFLSLFEDKKQLTVNKTYEIFNYYLLLIFKYAKDEIEKFQIQNEIEKNQLNEKTIQQLDNYYSKENILINKKSFANAIRLFITLVLFRESEKEKIKSNRKDLVDYLKSRDLWDNKIYNDEKFNENLNELKLCNIKINQTLWLYNYLSGNEEENLFADVIEFIEENEEGNNKEDGKQFIINIDNENNKN